MGDFIPIRRPLVRGLMRGTSWIATALLCGAAQAATPREAGSSGSIPQPARERTVALVEALRGVASRSDARAFTAVDGFFDYEQILASVIAPRSDKFTVAERARFSESFRALIRLVAYPRSGQFFREAKFLVGQPQRDGSVPVEARVAGESVKTTIEFHWQGERIVDVSFDGDSLVKDYQNQFARIVDKEGAAGLQKRVDERRADEEKKK